ncbi:MAG TPA: arginine--tRNA ligase [Acidimicrobiales bacterium]|nr:arginine--tRNA ligase [Acidimicrobiales bacterium]
MPGLLAVIGSFFSPVFAELGEGAVLAPAAGALVVPGAAELAAVGLRPSQRADFQVDGCLALARKLGRPPHEVAEEVLTRANALGLPDVCEHAEVAGPGFINLVLSSDFLARQLQGLARAPETLGVGRSSQPLQVVVDYGAPNAAKQMHVGHLRSTIIGDALVRQLEFVGHQVRRENHVGDWGAPFGMLIEHLKQLGEDEAAEELAVGDLEAFYQAARAEYERDPAFAERARARVVLLQSGDPGTLDLWRMLVERSLSHFDEAFSLLGTKLTRDDVVGESFYNPMLPEVVADLDRAGLLVESDGALCTFPSGHTNREGAPLPLIVRNSAGGYTYAATDLAAIKDRVHRERAQLLVYVVGLPQAQHFQMVFETARMMGWLNGQAQAVHVGFGNVLGPDGKMFRTRQGGTVKLSELLGEAVDRARSLVEERAGEGRHAVEGGLEAIAHAVGLGAVKYADLCTDRVRDYRFDWDRMLSLDGNTAPYIQYAHARTASLLRRAAEEGVAGAANLAGVPAPAGPVTVSGNLSLLEAYLAQPPRQPEEKELAKRILGFPDALAASLETYSPHKLCGYLFELASTFTAFYESSPVLRAPTSEVRSARLALSALSGQVLRVGLGLLGIEAPERM